MNVQKCLNLLMKRLGGRTSPELRATCLEEMQLFQETECEGAEELPWFLITERAETDLEIGEPRIGLPSDFIREVEEKDLVLIDEEGTLIELKKTSYEYLEEQYANAEPGTPAHYVIRGNYIIIGPASDRALVVRFPAYYARQESPSDSAESENAWFKWASDLMMAGAGLVMATLHLKDPELITTFTAQQVRARERLWKSITAREEANRERRMG